MKIYQNITLMCLLFFIPFFSAYGIAQKSDISIEASLPEKMKISIYGLASPNSIIQATGTRTFGSTQSDAYGNFVIKNLPVADNADEACLFQIDSERRISSPLCIPLEKMEDGSELGPMLLPPTVSLENDTVYQNSKISLSGKTIPGSEIELSVFPQGKNSKKKTRAFDFHHVFAQNSTNLYSKSNLSGNFSFDLPSQEADSYRLFAKTIYRSSPTQKSQTLFYKIIPLSKRISLYTFILIFIMVTILSILAGVILLLHKKRNTNINIEDIQIRSKSISYIIEKQLQPAVVNLYLSLKRLFYKFLGSDYSNQK